MSRAVRLVLTPIAALALLAGPVGAEEPIEPVVEEGCVDSETSELVLTEEQTFLHQAETKAGNLGAFDLTGLPSWDTEAPTQSVQAGAGGGYLGNSASYLEPSVAEQTGLTLEGDFAGCLDTMLLDLYAIMPTNRTSTSGDLKERALSVMVTMTVDGESILSAMEIATNTIANPGGDATHWARFGITDLHAALEDFGIDPTADHTIRLTLAPRYLNTDNVIFVYDTTEVPAGITFNGEPTEDYPLVSAW